MSRYYEFSRFRVDLEDRQLEHEGEILALTPKAFDTLLALVERPGRVVTKDELLTTVWPETFVEEATLTQNVYTLRKTLAAAGAQGPFIETIPRRGYRFVEPVRRVDSDGLRPFTAQREPTLSRHTIAVMPFQVLGKVDDAELIGVGLADALITRLSQLRQLVVRPTSAVLRYAEAEIDPAAVGRDLQVEAVLTGTIQAAGQGTRVGVQLVSVVDDSPIWAQQLDVAAKPASAPGPPDPFALQDSISEQVVQALRLQLTRQEEDLLTGRHTVSAAAARSYMRGRFFWNKRTAEDLEKALAYFQQAVEEDELYARAHAGLADTYVLLPLYAGHSPHKVFPEAERAAQRALELDGNLAEARTSLAYAHFVYGWDWTAARQGFRQALELNPSYANAHHWYAFFLAAMGQYEEAVASAKRAVDLDPLSMVINTDLAFVHYFGRRPELAVEQLERTLELDPEFPYTRFALGLALFEAGRTDEAIEQAGQAVELSHGENAALLAAHGHLMARAGRTAEARAVLERLEALDRRGQAQAGNFALLFAGLGEVEPAMAQLRKASEERSRFLVFLAVWPVFDGLRDHAGFRQLLADLKLGDG